MSSEVLLFGGAAVVALLAFSVLILAPAVGSFGRPWEKVTAAVLSFIVLVALIALGAAIGAVVIYFWAEISSFFGGSIAR